MIAKSPNVITDQIIRTMKLYVPSDIVSPGLTNPQHFHGSSHGVNTRLKEAYTDIGSLPLLSDDYERDNANQEREKLYGISKDVTLVRLAGLNLIYPKNPLAIEDLRDDFHAEARFIGASVFQSDRSDFTIKLDNLDDLFKLQKISTKRDPLNRLFYVREVEYTKIFHHTDRI